MEHHSEQHDAHRETQSAHGQRISFLEKVILALAGAIFIIAQEKFPEVAALLKRILL